MARLAALIASYRSGAFALACARSLQREWARAGRRVDDLDLIVVDDASPTPEGTWLGQVAATGARVLRRERRGGYSAAIASGLALTRGGPDDLVAVLNADLLFLPGSLAPLCALLERDPSVGAVAPRAFADPACALELPPQELPTPARELGAQAAALLPGLARRRADARLRRALPAWEARGPFEAEMLSGACLLLRRGWIERAGGLLDLRFPLYFEDTDLCRRLRARGARLVVEPRSRIVHFWARSTGLGEDFERVAAERFRASRRLYLERWHARAGADAVEAGERLLAAAPGRDAPIHAFTDLGPTAAPPRLELGREMRFVLEVGLSPTLALAAGALGEGGSWSLPARAWEWLHPARYFARALERGSGALLGAWSFVKDAPAREDPAALDLEEAPGERRVA